MLRTHEWAPRVLIANSNLVGKWANWDHFRELEKAGLMMYGQMTAGSWIYIGTQGILQGRTRRSPSWRASTSAGTLRGRVTLTAGLGGMGGAQPLAVTMNEGVAIVIEVDPARAKRRLDIGYVDRLTESPDEALDDGAGRPPRQGAVDRPRRQRGGDRARLGEGGRALRRRHRPDLGPRRAGRLRPGGDLARGRGRACASTSPTSTSAARCASMAAHVRAMLAFQRAGAVVFDYGNNLRAQAKEAGVDDAFDYPGFVPAFIRPQFCEGRGPFRWAALSGDPNDILRTDRGDPRAVPGRRGARALDHAGRGEVPFQGLPARICWLGYGERARAGLAFNDLVATGEVSAPIVIGRDHLDSGSVASPNRETEAMRDGTDAVADWPLLNALVNTAAGADVGVASTTAAASGSATASTPAWWWWPTARSSRRGSWSAC